MIAANLPEYINALWAMGEPVTDLLPWYHHTYNAEQFHHPLPDIPEWYEGSWVRIGDYQDGVQLRYPEEVRFRIEIRND